MRRWDPFHGWMRFQALDDCRGLNGAFTIGYRFTDDQSDEWTRRFNAFKSEQERAIYGALNVMRAATPELLRGLGINSKSAVFVPAPASDEREAAKTNALSFVARETAKACGMGFERKAVQKNPHQSLHTLRTAEDRSAALDQAEYRCGVISASNVLIFDDFITRGSTLSRIALSIQKRNPRIGVYGLGLCKTEGREYNRQFGNELSNEHILDRWRLLWERGSNR